MIRESSSYVNSFLTYLEFKNIQVPIASNLNEAEIDFDLPQERTMRRDANANAGTFNQSDLRITKEVLAVGKPSFRPVLRKKGEISREVLRLCDSKKSVEEIAELIRAEYPDRYESFEEAVREVVGVIRKLVRIG